MKISRWMEDGRFMTSFYYCSINHQSGLQINYHLSFNTSKCASNYVISYAVYDGSIGQNILKLWRQGSWPFGPAWAAHITSIGSWTCRLSFIEQLMQLKAFSVLSSLSSVIFLNITWTKSSIYIRLLRFI
jgi:hypothetical protein